jgi:hypothetical protein
MKVTVTDITQIKAGKAKSFACDTPLQARSGQSQVSYVKKYRRDLMPSDVEDYQTSINGSVLTIQAISK